MQRTKPPFRADQVGSLLRSQPVKEARTKRLAGEIKPAELKAVEDAEIKKLVARQESIGLQAVTDGEFRRSWWHYDFLAKLDGVELVSVTQGLQFKGTETKAEGLHVHGKIDFSASHPMIDHFKYLKSVAKSVPKMTIPSPTALHYRGGRQAIEKSVYPEMEPFFGDLGRAYGKAVRAFGEAGCTYLQLDEVFVAYLCDERLRRPRQPRQLGRRCAHHGPLPPRRHPRAQ
jgi:5-methyltetrahydropteroyltriglutamate--homocysteine methyltransferase